MFRAAQYCGIQLPLIIAYLTNFCFIPNRTLMTSNIEAMCLACHKSPHSRVVTIPLLHALASHTMLANYIWHHPIL